MTPASRRRSLPVCQACTPQALHADRDGRTAQRHQLAGPALQSAGPKAKGNRVQKK